MVSSVAEKNNPTSKLQPRSMTAEMAAGGTPRDRRMPVPRRPKNEKSHRDEDPPEKIRPQRGRLQHGTSLRPFNPDNEMYRGGASKKSKKFFANILQKNL